MDNEKEPYEKILFNKKNQNYVIYAILFLFVIIWIYNAWVGDDAYITFRTVDNFINGFGLTWNVNERVQAYTHPLWMFLHIPIYALIDNIYITTMLLSFTFSFASVYLLTFNLADSKLNAIAGLIILIISKTFIDYTSSGLENPLTFFLIILFLSYYFKDYEVKKKILILSLITSLATLNRMDTILLLLPALLYLLIKNWNLKYLLQIVYGLLPLLIWEIFSILYYGFPFPNTFYAKLNTGVPVGDYLLQGFYYYLDFLKIDPVSFIVVFIGFLGLIVYSLKFRENIFMPFLTGILIYFIYILRIGGDFMSGRFFSAPTFLILTLLSLIDIKYNTKKKFQVISVIVLLLVSLKFTFNVKNQTSYYEIRNTENFNNYQYFKELDNKWHGIVDEKNYYYKDNSLIKSFQNFNFKPEIPEAKSGKLSKNTYHICFLRIMIGTFSYYSGPDIWIIDRVALSDPLLSRLSITNDTLFTSGWRIGHFLRKVPKGYVESIQTSTNQIEDPKICKFYDKLKIITQGEIFNFKRYKEIWRMNTGYYDHLLHNNYEENDLPVLFAGDENSLMTYYQRMGNYYYLKYMDRKALNYYRILVDNEKWIRLRDASDNIYEKVTKLYMKFNNKDSAVYFAEKGLVYSKSKESAEYFTIILSNHYEQNNQFKRAYVLLSEFLKRFPKDIPVLKEFANFFILVNKDKRAVDIWKYIIEINPELSFAYYNIFKYYYNLHNYKLAANYAYKAVEKGEKIDKEILIFLNKYK
jgi:arabinofuranosyltransferase